VLCQLGCLLRSHVILVNVTLMALLAELLRSQDLGSRLIRIGLVLALSGGTGCCRSIVSIILYRLVG